MDIIDKRYKRGKIYKIVCNETGEIYYGSTIKKYLSNRIAHHRVKNCCSRQIINRNNYYYELIEDYSCNNKKELETRERWYIENNECINKLIPIRTKEEIKEYHKEYYQQNKEQIKEKKKQYLKDYYQENKEKLLEKRKEKITCDVCGAIVRIDGIREHQRTKKCLEILNLNK